MEEKLGKLYPYEKEFRRDENKALEYLPFSAQAENHRREGCYRGGEKILSNKQQKEANEILIINCLCESF